MHRAQFIAVRTNKHFVAVVRFIKKTKIKVNEKQIMQIELSLTKMFRRDKKRY